MSESQAHQSNHSTTTADVAFDMLSSRRRRYILYYLIQRTGAVELRELAHQLMMWDETAIDDHERISMSLYHVHLPKLEESGILTFDSTQRLIKLEATANELKPYLELAAEDDFQREVFESGSIRGVE